MTQRADVNGRKDKRNVIWSNESTLGMAQVHLSAYRARSVPIMMYFF